MYDFSDFVWNEEVVQKPIESIEEYNRLVDKRKLKDRERVDALLDLPPATEEELAEIDELLATPIPETDENGVYRGSEEDDKDSTDIDTSVSSKSEDFSGLIEDWRLSCDILNNE